MKIRSLRIRADAMAAEARADRTALGEHAARSWSIFKRRVGSPAGLAIFFSLGFMGGAGRDRRHAPASGERRAERKRGLARKLLHGPLGENALKLGSAIVASSLMKYLDERDDERAAPAPPVPPPQRAA